MYIGRARALKLHLIHLQEGGLNPLLSHAIGDVLKDEEGERKDGDHGDQRGHAKRFEAEPLTNARGHYSAPVNI
jgi:hypothetical protein